MRKLLFSVAIIVASLGYGLTPQSCFAAEQNMTTIALSTYQMPLGERLKRLAHPENSFQTAFCGQCKKDADCGVGFRCTGRPECMECKKSP